MGTSYGTGYFDSAAARQKAAEFRQKEENRVSDLRYKIAAKIVMAVVDKIVTDIVRPGPVAEERECYEMAGEMRAIVPELEKLAKHVIDAEDGIE